MGLFGKFSYSGGRWSTAGPTAVPFLLIDVHDSDVATVDYRAADATGGRFFLGYEQRIYFDEPDATDPVDVRAESEGFAQWLLQAEGRQVDPAAVQELMASPDGAPPEDEVVEETVDRLVALAGLPPLTWPTDDDAPPG
ncbi:hypothetical protein [Blastococcus sp. CT_GayMR16]|uniref:hypothetical protein n=1 Tax=Blastococcus sp. CT_GayMR16 TaxID=2559607 RepID=UPI0010732982|nr:hypothetical protein [Blastococcus sp. CT_GayMR16]TFV91356.1 hypothetical protein E4P38_01835 [Blastococcus sp. CT_GayMR16]